MATNIRNTRESLPRGESDMTALEWSRRPNKKRKEHMKTNPFLFSNVLSIFPFSAALRAFCSLQLVACLCF